MKMYYYYLKGKTIHRTTSVFVWGREFKKNRVVEQTDIGDVRVSTVFLGLDYRFPPNNKKPPILFETMIFGGVADEYQERYETWEQAEQGHKLACDMVLSTFAIETDELKKQIIKTLN